MAKDFADINRLEGEAGLQASNVVSTADAKQDITSRFVALWEKKNAQRALRGGAVSTMALTLAACGDDDDDPVEPTDPTPTAQSFTLTTDADTGEEFTGGAGDDTFDAPVVESQGGDLIQTLQDADDIDGGDGTDTLTAGLRDGAVAPVIANIENLFLRDTLDNGSLDASFITGAEQIWSDRSTQELDVDDVQNLVTIGLDNTEANYSLAYDADNLGADDVTQSVVLRNGVGEDGTPVELTLGAGGDDAITTLDISNSGESFLNIDQETVTDTIETVNVSGSGSLALGEDDNAFANLATVAAGDFEGDLSVSGFGLDLSTADSSFSLTGGSGDDQFDVADVLQDLSGANLTLSIDGGAGANTLVVSDAGGNDPIDNANLDAGEITNIQTVEADLTAGASEEDQTAGASDLNVTQVGGIQDAVISDLENATTVTLNAGTNVTVAANAANNDALTIAVDDADADNLATQNLTLGDAEGEAGLAAALGQVTASLVETLNLTSVGGANEIGALDGDSSMSTISVQADEDLTVGGTTADGLIAGAQDASDVITLEFAGAGDVVLGDLAIDGENQNRIDVSSDGAGDRTFGINGQADLAATAAAGQSAGEGVVITGDGTGVVTLKATGVAANGLTVDGTGYASGEVTVDITTAVDVDAEDFSGVDTVNLTDAAVDNELSNLDASTTVRVIVDADVDLVDSVTERNVVLANAKVSSLEDNSATTLNLSTDDADATLGTLTATALDTLNVTADSMAGEKGNFTLTNLYTTKAGTAGSRTFDLNVSGGDDFTLTDGLKVGADTDTLTLTANGDGARDFGIVRVGDLSDNGSVVFDGDSDASATVALGEGAIGVDVDLSGDGDVTLADITGGVADAETITINSQSSDGSGTNTVTDPTKVDIGKGSTLEITGNQDLVFDGNLSLAQADAETGTLDASAFTGDLTTGLERLVVVGGGTSEVQTVELGSGDDTITIDRVADSAGDDTFSFVFSTTSIGTDTISNFSTDQAAGQEEDDVLDFSALITATLDANSFDDLSANGVGTIVDDAGNEILTVDGTANGDADVLISAADGQFEGSVQLVGVGDATTLNADNFTFA